MARPSKLTVALIAKLEPIAGNGWTLKQVCREIGIDDDTWRSWENREPGDDTHTRFLGLAARVRAGMGVAVNDLAWGTLREVIEDPDAPRADRIAAATNALRLQTAHRVELTGANGGPIRSAGPDLSKLTDAELRQLRELTAKAEGSDA